MNDPNVIVEYRYSGGDIETDRHALWSGGRGRNEIWINRILCLVRSCGEDCEEVYAGSP